MLSVTCKTAIKAVIYLASKYESEERAGIKEIATYINASEHSVGKLLQTLVKKNIINSFKGPGGGFYISAHQMSIPLMQIVQAIDGEDVFSQCGLGLNKCSSHHPCPLHNHYKPIMDMFKGLCAQNKISDLCAPVNEGIAYLMG